MVDEDNKANGEVEIDTDRGDYAADDVTFEMNPDGVEHDIKDRTDKLKARIKELEKKNGELLDSWQRDKADFLNSRKRDESEKQEFLKFAKRDLIEELLPALDAFDSAMKNKEAWEKVEKNWRVGVEYISSQLHKVLAEHGLKVINPLGEMYNEKRDEAIEMVKTEDKAQDGKVLDVVQVGYELNGKEIRAPKVKVGNL
jgi:molecular chaperone GrpE